MIIKEKMKVDIFDISKFTKSYIFNFVFIGIIYSALFTAHHYSRYKIKKQSLEEILISQNIKQKE
jgi:hypothetical protein